MLRQRSPLTPFYLFEFEQNVRNKAMLYIQNIQPGDFTFILLFVHLKTSWYEKGNQTGAWY